MALPDAYVARSIHVETGVFFLFLIMVLTVQLERAQEFTSYLRNPRRQFAAFFGLFVLFAAVFLRFLGDASPILAIQLAAGMTLALLHPVNALCLFVHLLFLRPWELIPDNPLLLGLPRFLGVVWFISWLMHPSHRAVLSRTSWRALILLSVFSVWLFWSTFQASQVGQAQSAWFDAYSKSLMVFMMALFSLESERSLSEVKWCLLLSTFGLMLLGFVEFIAYGSGAPRLGSMGVFAGPNELGVLITMVLPFAVALLFRRSPTLMSRLTGWVFGAFSLGVIWYTRSRGALLALAIQTLSWMAWVRPRARWSSILILSALLGFGYVVLVKAIPRSRGDMDESRENRLIFWKAAVEMTRDYPIRGVGFNQYRENYEAYTTVRRLEKGKRTAHSSWLLVFAESGIVGGLLYLAFFITVFMTAWRHRIRWPDHLCALIGFAVGMTFLSITYSLYFFILAGLIIGSDAVRHRMRHVA